MIVSWDGEAPIRMRDVARIEDGSEDVRDASYMNGKRGIALGLSKQSKGNTVAIVDELFRRMDEIAQAHARRNPDRRSRRASSTTRR